MNARSLEIRIARFVGSYTPEVAALLRGARARLHAMFPKGCELVYDNYNALVFAFGPTERASQLVLSIAGYPRWVTLFFRYGATLADPERLLEGSGSQIRGVRLASPRDLESAPIRDLIAQAVGRVAAAFATAPPRRTVIRSVADKQRPRRPVAAVTKTTKTTNTTKTARTKKRGAAKARRRP